MISKGLGLPCRPPSTPSDSWCQLLLGGLTLTAGLMKQRPDRDRWPDETKG